MVNTNGYFACIALPVVFNKGSYSNVVNSLVLRKLLRISYVAAAECSPWWNDPIMVLYFAMSPFASQCSKKMNTIKFFDILFTSSDIFPIYIELKAFIKHFPKILFLTLQLSEWKRIAILIQRWFRTRAHIISGVEKSFKIRTISPWPSLPRRRRRRLPMVPYRLLASVVKDVSFAGLRWGTRMAFHFCSWLLCQQKLFLLLHFQGKDSHTINRLPAPSSPILFS